ncbi:hypothetical protein ACU4GR_32510 (plasmid) [Methylobacterium oryzae CBMB20]
MMRSAGVSNAATSADFVDWDLAAGLDASGDELLRLARRWLDTHQQIGVLLGIPEPLHVAQVRAALLLAARDPDHDRANCPTRGWRADDVVA